MDVHLVTLRIGITPIQIENVIVDIEEKLKSGTIVEESLERLKQWPANRKFLLAYDGGRYTIIRRENGSFTATLGGTLTACPPTWQYPASFARRCASIHWSWA
jgi:hypothetical protein